jgi:SPP1 family phage portal protein
LGILNWNSNKAIDLPTPKPNSDIHKLEVVLRAWLDSPQRKEQLLAEQYYLGNQDILKREKKVIGADGNLTSINNVTINRIVDNVYAKLVNQKTSYCLGKPITIATSDDDYLKLLTKIFNKRNHRTLRELAQFAVNEGIAYIYPYYNADGEFKFAVFPAHEICPIWRDKRHHELESAMRYYPEEVFDNNGGVTLVYHVDLFTTYGITHFRYQGGSLIIDEQAHTDYMYVENVGYNWKKLPIIPFKYNSEELPLIRRVKTLQDALNEVMSNFKDNMDEDPRTSILILKNYDGTNIPEFRQNLATYGVIKVTTVDGVQGDVDALKVEVNSSNYQALLMQLKRAIIENGYGFDAKEERMDGDPNQMNIESMYTDIDLDVDAMESEFQAGFEELKWFIDQYLIHTGNPDYTEEDVEFIFDRDFFINENAQIDNVMKSVGLVSKKTLLSHHPMVTNVLREMQLIEEEEQAELEKTKAEMEIQHAFDTPQTIEE